MTPEEWLERQEGIREIAGALEPMYEIASTFRAGFVAAGYGGETADVLGAQMFQNLVLPMLEQPTSGLGQAARIALETLRKAQRLDMTKPPVDAAELRAAVEALEAALA